MKCSTHISSFLESETNIQIVQQEFLRLHFNFAQTDKLTFCRKNH